MKRVFCKWWLLGGSLLIPVALAAGGANEPPSWPDTSNAEAEVIDQTPANDEVELGLLELLFNRKRGEDGEQAINDGKALSGVEVKEVYDGPLEELGLLDFLLGKEPQPLVIAASIPEVNVPVPEPIAEPVPEVGLFSYLFNRGDQPSMSAVATAPAISGAQPTLATARSATSRSPVFARSATHVESAAMSDDLLRIKVVLGLLPRSALASLGQSNYVATTSRVRNAKPSVVYTEPATEVAQKDDSQDSGTAAKLEEQGLLGLLFHRRPKAAVIAEPLVAKTEPETGVAQKDDSQDSGTAAKLEEQGLLGLLFHRRPKAAEITEPLVANIEPETEVAQKDDSQDSGTAAELEEQGLLGLLFHRRPKAAEIAAPLVAKTEPETVVAQKDDSPDSATLAEVEVKGLLELLIRRRPDVAGVETTETPSGDKTNLTSGAEQGELGLFDLLFGKNSDIPEDNTATPTDPDQNETKGSSE